MCISRKSIELYKLNTILHLPSLCAQSCLKMFNLKFSKLVHFTFMSRKKIIFQTVMTICIIQFIYVHLTCL